MTEVTGAEPCLVLQMDGVQMGFVADEEGGDVGWIYRHIQERFS
ncbi:hypothetical protein PCH70_01880 [Pseudomonas cichorii JBC1]|nr:hypothetical protein PCH70_01880 [Pseudomonas cichorii JBC1]